jgi:hypothetical protein
VTIAPGKRKKQTIWRDDEDDDDDEDAGSDYFATPPKRNKPATTRKKQHKKRKATINSDLVFGAVDPGANDENEASVDEDLATTADPKSGADEDVLRDVPPYR